MSVAVRPLTPELAQAFADYLGNLDFAHAPHWATCFCRYYHTDCTMEEWMQRPGERNRREAIAAIETGAMGGYLAFDGETCIGWCNAADTGSLIRLRDDLKPYCQGKAVGCTICYVIHPDYRGRGVARQLLKAAMDGFAVKGYDAMIALPFEDSAVPQKRYRGTRNMYEQAGFREIGRQDAVSVMWRDLKA